MSNRWRAFDIIGVPGLRVLNDIKNKQILHTHRNDDLVRLLAIRTLWIPKVCIKLPLRCDHVLKFTEGYKLVSILPGKPCIGYRLRSRGELFHSQLMPRHGSSYSNCKDHNNLNNE